MSVEQHYLDGGVGYSGSAETSKASAATVATRARGMRALFERDVRSRGLEGTTCDEAGARQGFARTQTQPRFSDLHRLGKIVDSGKRRPNASGCQAIVWVVPEFAPPGVYPKGDSADEEVSAIMVRLARFQTWLAEQAANRADDRALAAGAKLVSDVRGLISARGLKRKGTTNG